MGHNDIILNKVETDAGASVVYTTPAAAYKLVYDDDTSTPTTYEYYGYEDKDANWYIRRYDVVNAKSEFVAGTGGGITPEWAGRAGKTYGTYGSTF